MTSEESRQLDAEIAARVFGCRVAWRRSIEYGSRPCCDCENAHHGQSYYGGGLPEYSGSIAAAFAVVPESLRQYPGAGFAMRYIPGESWIAQIGWRSGVGQTASEAICRAALAALASVKE